MHAGLIELDLQGAIADDLPCLDCGYNLRGLRREGMCPECGRAVEDALSGGRVRFADPGWIDRVANGCGWLAAGLLVSLLNCQITGAEPLLFLVFDVLPLGLILLGVWRLSLPDRSPLVPADYERARRWVRPMVGAWAVAALLVSALGQAQSGLAEFGFALSGLLSGLAVFATCRLGHKLALRMDEPRLARAARRVGVVWLVLAAGVSVGGLMAMLLMGRSPGGGSGAGGAGTNTGVYLTVYGHHYPAPTWFWPILLVIALIFLVFGIWLLVLPFQFRSRLRQYVPRLQ